MPAVSVTSEIRRFVLEMLTSGVDMESLRAIRLN